MEKWIVDRFEGDFAVCEAEDRSWKFVERAVLPTELREGDVLVLADSGEFRVDQEFTETRRARISDLMEELYKV